MKDNGTPVLILFILTIVVLLYNFVDEYIDVNSNLRDTIYEQQLIIKQKVDENRALANLVSYMYQAQTGKEIPQGWDDALKHPESSPVH